MGLLAKALRKIAYVPLTPAAQQAVDQQMGGMPPADPSMQGAAPMPPPQDPAAMQGGMPPMPAEDPNAMAQQGAAPMQPAAQGQMPPIQIIQGPNGEPVDAETGFIVLDPQQGIEQDPLTGIFFNKSLMEFADANGNVLDPNTAIQMIEQARQGGAAAPAPEQAPAAPAEQMPAQPVPAMDPAMAQQPPMMQQQAAEDPAMAGAAQGIPADPAMMAPEAAPEAAPAAMDPSTGVAVDPATGMPIDPSTGAPVDPSTGATVAAPAQALPVEQAASELFNAIPGLQEFVTSVPKQLESQDKTMGRLQSDVSNTRTDIQGLRREIQKTNDNQNTMLGRMDNLLQLVESMLAGKQPAVEAETIIPAQSNQ